MSDLVILVPMLGRPHTITPLLESIRSATPRADVLWLLTEGDTEVRDTIAGGDHITFPPRARGDYAAKINAGVKATTHPHIFTGACDLRFRRGWYEACLRRLKPGVGVVGTNDLTNARTVRGEHATHMLLTRDYATLPTIDDQPGPMFEGYLHEYVDDELVGTAKRRGAWVHERSAVVEHLHPMRRKAPMDDLYALQGDRMMQDRALFQRRRKLWT